ncbi:MULTISPECIES: hypothetical protein [Methylosinus]|uniref:Uncharacterized protein n=1 Tax=Methylosinus trichosporium (strain ATCC 35070 / NCIMB 11131 / UNIQEM 75 / OB3b) TaxID=595536 RepID=A0A2D2D163_METT3|nr:MULTISPECIES: hypothetical protein [Methylosinus]ATQ68733.1 hypothetical protein CQW49_13210 [Methylosinus trichosporium OB3b]OBS53108.1 hypothetical protein A8B73_07305 [Methylosinus sp. 3S-1]
MGRWLALARADASEKILKAPLGGTLKTLETSRAVGSEGFEGSGPDACAKNFAARTPDPSPAEPPDIAVAKLLDAMAAENAARRDWWTKPEPEHGSGRITIRSVATGESVTIHLPRGSAGR